MGIDTLINHMRGMVFPLTEHESKELFRQYCRPGGESVKQYVSRRRRCWTLLVQMDPVIHLSEGRRSDMLLDLSSLTREERVMVQASIDNERDFDRVADALIIQHPRIHLRACRKRTKGKGKDGIKRGDNSNTRWLQEKGKHTGSENMEQVLIAQTLLPLKITILMTTRSGKQMLIKPTMTQWIPEAMTEKKLRITIDTFSSSVALDDVSVFEATELDAIALLADTWDNDLDPEVSAQLVRANVQACFSFGKEKGKGNRKGKGKGKFPVCPSCLPFGDRRQRLRELKAKSECRVCGRKGHWAHDRECAMSPSSLSSKNPDQYSSYDETTAPLQPTEEGHNVFRFQRLQR